jgi:hypothetical protein
MATDSLEVETLKGHVVENALDWYKSQCEELQVNRLADDVYRNPDATLEQRYEAATMSKQAALYRAENESKMVQTLGRLSSVLDKESKRSSNG